MTKEQEIEAGRKIYADIKRCLDKWQSLDYILNLGYETYIWDKEDGTHKGHATTYNINFIGSDATINVMIDYYPDTRKYEIDEHFELVSRENDDWDGVYYGL